MTPALLDDFLSANYDYVNKLRLFPLKTRFGTGPIPPPPKNEPLDMPVERFLASLRFEHKGKLDQLGIKPGNFDLKLGNKRFESNAQNSE